jgi:hypothetical protein
MGGDATSPRRLVSADQQHRQSFKKGASVMFAALDFDTVHHILRLTILLLLLVLLRMSHRRRW